jgi:hypothetical protein
LFIATLMMYSVGCGSAASKTSGDSDPFTGFFRLEEHLESTDGCDAFEVVLHDAPRQFLIEASEGQAGSELRVFECRSPSDCDQEPYSNWILTQQQERTWTGDSGLTYTAGAQCRISFNALSADFVDGKVVMLKRRLGGAYPPPNGKLCTDRGVRDRLLSDNREQMVCQAAESMILLPL